MSMESERPDSTEGWLTAYYVYILIAALLCLLEVIGSRPWGDYAWSHQSLPAGPFIMALIKFGIYAFAANSLKRIETRWVPKFHIALNAISAIVAGLILVGYATSLSILTLVPWSLLYYFELPYSYIVLPLIWTVYWVVSKRVKNSYPADGNSDLAPMWVRNRNLAPAIAKSSTRAWAFAMLIASLMTLVPWILFSRTVLLMTFANNKGFQPWLLVYFLYPLILLAVSVYSFRLIKRGKFRRARVVSAIPIALFILSGAASLHDRVPPMQYDRIAAADTLNRQRDRESARQVEHPEGAFTELYESGQKKMEGHYDSDGRKDGLVTTWYQSGQKQSEVTYAGGESIAQTSWYENGQKETETTASLFLHWGEDGQQLSEITVVDERFHTGYTGYLDDDGVRTENRYVDGETVRNSTWHPSGQKKSEASGPIGSRGDRESLRTWYENGQIKSEMTWSESTDTGESIRTKHSATWYENGQQESVETFVDDENLDSTSWYISGQKSSQAHKTQGETNRHSGWNEDGQLVSETIVEEDPQSTWGNSVATEWYDNGNKKSQWHRHHGQVDRQIAWYENGHMESDKNKELTLPDKYGYEKEWYSNGNPRREWNRVAQGKRHVKTWYENRQLQAQYKDSFYDKVGLSTRWYENGQKQSEICRVGYNKTIKYELTWDENGNQTSPPYDGDLECPEEF